jgi:hypothetical protein
MKELQTAISYYEDARESERLNAVAANKGEDFETPAVLTQETTDARAQLQTALGAAELSGNRDDPLAVQACRLLDIPTISEVYTRIAEKQHGFVTKADVQRIPYKNLRVLVRCGASRFLCTLDELAQRLAGVEEAGDYVRDVSIPANPKPNDWVNLGYRPPS